MSKKGFDAIRLRFEPDTSEDHVLRLIAMALSKIQPETHFRFVTDGYRLALGGSESARTVVVQELPPCLHGYENVWRQDSYRAALEAVHALLV